MHERAYEKGVVKIGVVAYAPKVVTIWEGIKDYLRGQGFNADWILYSNYPALVEALVAGRVDIAWNTPLAYLQAKEKLGGQCQVLAMRDTDVGFTTVFITQTDSPIRALSDLNGKRFALASRDSSHAAILPLYFLHQNGIHPDTDLTLLRFDTDVGKHGDTGTSEEEVVRAVLNGEAEAGALGKATWDAHVAAGRIDPQTLRIFWTSPGYCHCNFTARADFSPALAERFTQVILAMDYQQPEQKRIMDLEGLTRWVPGRTQGYQELEDEARALNLLS
ncbi:MAG: PhnD/SsuA/transferrin family substrate-binding protein [Deltaproteobacteria bacterium]|nr:PhnD/SsuA/transferrin family substrate-binding protein [Deltaproteobacteria bacterium]